MKKQRYRFFSGGAAVMLVLLVSACATTRGVPRQHAVTNLVELVNSGNIPLIGDVTNIPMLIDGEIVSRAQEASSFWKQVHAAGFRLQEQKNIPVEPVDAKTYLLFGDTMEVRTFFSKYVPKTAVTAEVQGSGGQYIFLLSGRKGKYPYIFGFTGPVQ